MSEGPVVACAKAPQDMRRLGAALSKVLRPGDTVLVDGDLGSGKTTFTQGLAGALGVAGPVTSPTFVLVHSYPTAAGWDLLHADVWRIEQLQEVIDLAIPELQEAGAAAIVEWGELASPALGGDCLHVAIALEADAACDEGPEGCGPGGARRVTFRASGPSWARRMEVLRAALEGTGLPATELAATELAATDPPSGGPAA
ncbi:MAG: tRNA (adenosine(37)-N6)-threonylcarbamoyltransferase complex ATPase subunit type 1 TsaE [Actinobacteria bacterium]|nr:tRNA (adenosine(37)-N6)-threonylcarbamoyltransferase complex ATPase subunit type 1 TsaE [Actinomycetota bacterium]